MKLSEAKLNQTITISDLGGDLLTRKKLLSLGILKDRNFKIINKQICGNMIVANDYVCVALDKNLASQIRVNQ